MKQRSAKKIRKWKEKFERERELRQEIRAAAPDILRSKNFRSTRSHVQHGNMTVNDHSMNVAKYSLAISEKLHISCTTGIRRIMSALISFTDSIIQVEHLRMRSRNIS